MPESDLLRFWAKVDLKGADECWEWQGTRFAHGYGEFMFGRHQTAHRIAYKDCVGPIPGRRIVKQACCNRLCSNPAHMALGHNGHVLTSDSQYN